MHVGSSRFGVVTGGQEGQTTVPAEPVCVPGLCRARPCGRLFSPGRWIPRGHRASPSVCPSNVP